MMMNDGLLLQKTDGVDSLLIQFLPNVLHKSEDSSVEKLFSQISSNLKSNHLRGSQKIHYLLMNGNFVLILFVEII